MTIATLTGHAYLTTGEGYSVSDGFFADASTSSAHPPAQKFLTHFSYHFAQIVMDNAAARKADNAITLHKVSEQIGDPFEFSTIRREDYKFHRGTEEG